MKPFARRRARMCAVQALYSWQVSRNEMADVEASFIAEQDMSNVDIAYFRELLSGISAEIQLLDKTMMPYLSRTLDELGHIERAVLRISVYELSKREDIPYKVIINEGIELAKIFGAEESYKFVNGVLDKIAPKLRYHEFRPKAKGE